MVYDKANELAKDIQASDEYKAFTEAKERVEQNETTIGLLKQYHKLQIEAQAAYVAGKQDDESLQKLQKLGELLQMDKDASAYLIAEYQLNRMLGDIYKILADAIQVNGFSKPNPPTTSGPPAALSFPLPRARSRSALHLPKPRKPSAKLLPE